MMANELRNKHVDVNHADELQFREQLFSRRQYSYDLAQKLTYYIVSAQLVTCGYVLLNSSNLVSVNNLSYVYLLAGLSAFTGILWRFFYNITYYNRAHGIYDCLHLISQKLQIIIYYLYVLFSIASFGLLLIEGYCYLNSLIIT